MAKVYFVRHQAAGILHEYPFAQPPTEAQLQAIARKCFQAHGGHHKKTGLDYWTKVVEVDLLGPDAVIDVPERSLAVANAAGAPEFSVKGTARVDPPAG